MITSKMCMLRHSAQMDDISLLRERTVGCISTTFRSERMSDSRVPSDVECTGEGEAMVVERGDRET